LSTWVTRPDWSTLLQAYARCVRITRDQKEKFILKPKAFIETSEKRLFDALEKAENQDRSPGSVDDFLNAFLPMIPAVNEFFDKILVMAEDRSIKENRLGLLQRITSLADGIADLGKLEGF
jgi:glycyl-tRNA synthetase beta subunit